PPSAGFSGTAHSRTPLKPQSFSVIESEESAVETAAPGPYQIFMPFVAPGYLQIPQVPDSAKVTILEDGLYHLSSDKIASAMGIYKWEAEELIKDTRLQITHKGKQVAYLPDEGNQGVHFYGWAIQSNYTKENIFWLSDGAGLKMDVITGSGPNPVYGLDPFTETSHREEEQYHATGLFSDPTADFWFWEMLIAEDPTLGTRSFTIRTDGVSPSGSATITVNVHSLSNTNANYDNHAVVTLNGTQIGDFLWDGLNPFDYDLHFEQGLINDGENTIEVTALVDSGVPWSVFYVDSFQLDYQRYYRAANDTLQAPAEDNPIVSIGGFSDLNIIVFDVTNPYQPQYLSATTLEYGTDGSRVSFYAATPGSRFLTLTRDNAKSPAWITPDSPSNLSSPSNNVDYLVIAPGAWTGVAQTLADYRQGQGLSVMVVDLEDIYDEFNFGLESPYAIKDFLAHAFTTWSGPPQYVVLAGEGTLDYQDNLGIGDNHIPPMLVSTSYGLYPADNTYADAVGNDGLADMAIGRLPASTSAELETLIAKIISYESSPDNGWQDQVFLLADNTDFAGDFPADSDDLAALIPAQFATDKIYLSDTTLSVARQELIDAINNGVAFVNYIGHAGPDRFTAEGLLVLSDLGALVNGAKLPVITTFTCFVGRFEIPGFDSIGEALVLDPDGGAIAVWAPTGLSINNEAKALGEGLFESIFQSGENVLGFAILSALQDYESGNHTFSLHEIYTLFGDPALQIKLNP
ncbi:MAG: C25 family cysteine peptidase, partial [Candidatus Hermodarchaeia archaeon]